MNWTELLEQLSQPFPATAIKWRAGSTNREKTMAQALPYAAPRAYEDRLNTVCPGDWSVTFKPWGERLICELTIHGVTRSSTGEENDGFAPGTATEAQAFKRACSKFGLGRYLYDLKAPWVGYDAEKKRLTEVPKLRLGTPPSVPPKGASARQEPPEKTEREKPTPASAPTLSRDRAQKMHIELGKLGIVNADQYAIASGSVGREVKSFTTLSEPEALAVLNAARKEASGRARFNPRPVGDEEALGLLN